MAQTYHANSDVNVRIGGTITNGPKMDVDFFGKSRKIGLMLKQNVLVWGSPGGFTHHQILQIVQNFRANPAVIGVNSRTPRKWPKWDLYFSDFRPNFRIFVGWCAESKETLPDNYGHSSETHVDTIEV